MTVAVSDECVFALRQFDRDFDAHIDYSPFVHDLRFTNAHAFRHIRPMLHVASLIQVGIRSLRNTSEAVGDAIRDGNRVITMT